MKQMGSSNLSLNIEFTDRKSAVAVLRKIADQLSQGKRNYDRWLENGCIAEYAVERVKVIDYREEEINGKWCRVIQSSMNADIPLKAKNVKL